jgi:hypothetical protein
MQELYYYAWGTPQYLFRTGQSSNAYGMGVTGSAIWGNYYTYFVR